MVNIQAVLSSRTPQKAKILPLILIARYSLDVATCACLGNLQQAEPKEDTRGAPSLLEGRRPTPTQQAG